MATARLQALTLADYGEPPGGLLGTVPYALNVLNRRYQLGNGLTAIRRLVKAAEDDAREGFVELGRALHQQAEHPALGPYQSLIAEVDQAQQLAGERSDEWNESRAAAETQRASFDAKIAQAEKAAGPFRDRETKLSTQVAVFETDMRRARAKLQRVDIELRNATDPERREALTAERAARTAEVEIAEGHLAEIAPQLAETRHELATILATVKELEAQKRAVSRASANTEQLYVKTAGAAEAELHDALARLAEAVLDDKAVAEVAPREMTRARQLATARLARRREQELHQVALASYDEESLRKGLTLIGVVVALLVVAVLLAIFV